jgi:hypothetical protein
MALCLVTCVATADAVLASMPSPEQPDFVDTVLASRAVVASLRMAVIFGAIFVVLSVVALVARRQWLTRVGSLEVGRCPIWTRTTRDSKKGFGRRTKRSKAWKRGSPVRIS